MVKNQQFIPIGADIIDGLAGLREWMSMDIPEACLKKAVHRIIQHVKDFFGRMKNEMFYGRSFVGVTIKTFIQIINDYITWYNTKRIKASLGYMSPMEYRQSLGLS